MALLEDPTIQRILDEVNRAATGGAFGLAGNYISEPSKPMSQPPKNDFFDQHQQEPLFYPTPDMFNMDGLTNLELNPMESMGPISPPANFDLYNTGLYNTFPSSMLSPYENYKNDMLNNNNNNSLNQMRPTSSVSSTNNDILLDHHRHQEYPTMPPKITAAIPNLGLNLRTPPPLLASTPVNLVETSDEIIPTETTDTATASIDLLADKDDCNSLPPNTNDEIDPPHICKTFLFIFYISIFDHILASAGRIFYDPNPQIIQRKGSNSVTYKQNIIVRFLQPPPIPNAGPLVIKEVNFLNHHQSILYLSF
jgi:hypothetical protein